MQQIAYKKRGHMYKKEFSTSCLSVNSKDVGLFLWKGQSGVVRRQPVNNRQRVRYTCLTQNIKANIFGWQTLI